MVLRQLREERGLSQEALAFHAGVTTGTLARLELGQSDPSWSTIRSVTKALDITLIELATAIEAHHDDVDEAPPS
jgi:transcriptional regulator with XRE-family HTH domain